MLPQPTCAYWNVAAVPRRLAMCRECKQLQVSVFWLGLVPLSAYCCGVIFNSDVGWIKLRSVYFALLVAPWLGFFFFAARDFARRVKASASFNLSAAQVFPRLALIAAVFLIFSSYIYQIVTMPSQAWDGLSFWYEQSAAYATFILNIDPHASGEAATFDIPYIHPATNAIIYSIVPSINIVMGWGLPGGLPSLLLTVAVCYLVILLVRVFSGGLLLMVLVCCGLISTPIYENTIILYGYPDIWVSVAGLLSVSSLILLAKKKKYEHYVVFFMSAIIPMITRDNGFAYSASILCVGFCAIGDNYLSGRRLLTLCGIMLACGMVAVYSGFDVRIGENRYGILWLENSVNLMVGQRYLDLVPQDPRAIFDAYLNSYVRNSSFTYAFLVSTIAALYIIFSRTFSFPKKIILLGIPITYFMIIAFVVSMSAFFMQHYSAPGSDKGLSRFSLSIFVAMLPAIIACITDVSQRYLVSEKGVG